MSKERVTAVMYSILIALAMMVLPATIPGKAAAQSICTEPSGDSDGDGFLDADECTTGITTAGSVPRTFPPCVAGVARDTCVDVNSKDLFVILKPATLGPAPTGSLLGNNGISLTSSPFRNVTVSGTNIAATFTGLSALGITVHLIEENNAGTANTGGDRVIQGTQKAIKITESVDPNGTILGNCQWGTPLDLDGCVVFTQRILNFINSACDSAGDRTTDRLAVFRAYAHFIILHEAGHTLGGLKGIYNSRFGGYHEKSGAGVIMEQSAAYAAKGGKCTFYISSGWNTSEDPSSVSLDGQ